MIFEYSRRGVEEVSERGQSVEDPGRDDLHVAVPHAPEVVEREEVHVDQAYGPRPHQERPRQRDPHRQRQQQRLHRRPKSSYHQNLKKQA